MTLGIALTVIPLLIIAGVVRLEYHAIQAKATAGTTELATANLVQLADAVYTLVDTNRVLLENQLRIQLRVACAHLDSLGKVTLETGSSVSWTARNQFTNQETTLSLPRLQVGNRWLGQEREAAASVPGGGRNSPDLGGFEYDFSAHECRRRHAPCRDECDRQKWQARRRHLHSGSQSGWPAQCRRSFGDQRKTLRGPRFCGGRLVRGWIPAGGGVQRRSHCNAVRRHSGKPGNRSFAPRAFLPQGRQDGLCLCPERDWQDTRPVRHLERRQTRWRECLGCPGCEWKLHHSPDLRTRTDLKPGRSSRTPLSLAKSGRRRRPPKRLCT